MGRRSHTQHLDLWMNGRHVGVWSRHAVRDTLSYSAAWADAPDGRPLSLSLPFQPGNLPHQGAAVRHYFSNLLPDSQPILERLAQRFKTGTTDAFDLLAEIGRDCVGALQIVPAGDDPGDPFVIEGEPLDNAGVARELAAAVAPGSGLGSLGGGGDFRISIAGAQEKTALLRVGDQWMRPRGATPTTHILKLPMGLVGNQKIDLNGSVENEWLCAQILAAYGLPVARCEKGDFNGTKALIVERFDRRWTPERKALLRLPQEDMCQATGTSPLVKYEVDGGPGMDRILGLLDSSEQRGKDRMNFFRAQLLFWLLCAPDGHAKNFSLHLQARGAFAMTPLYDVLSAYPWLGNGANQIKPFQVKLAMAVRGKNPHWKMRDVQRRHWNETARRNGLGDSVETIIAEILEKTPAVIARVGRELPAQFPARVADAIFSGLQDAAERLARMPE
ncbi:type II toxin-antitoxin system HipA family toxin [Polaromonas sp.]|uniref:type II toxin-antitoxin system HipA family toxin n=1 Tax=Polaromonas sp. TaxID=1869339 RepID=UPI003FA6E9C5